MIRLATFTVILAVGLLGCNSQVEQQQAATTTTATEDKRMAGALRIGETLPNFTLKTMDGTEISLKSQFKGDNVVAVIWHSPACPCANNCLAALQKEMDDPKYKEKLTILGVASDPFQNTEWFLNDLKAQQESGILNFPVVFDTDYKVKELYGVKRTPTVYVADSKGRLQFWGAPESTLFPGSEGHQFLMKDAVDALLEKKTPNPQTYPPIGCLIE
ncbi:MAG: redoxin domain-containing protein [Candidatus Sumerlaeia bacterium]|nr:redoxin domain-containing protein [Candidatus Sumerlaeia bacterium]